MRAGRLLSVSSADIRRLKTLVQDRNTPQKNVWRAEIVLLTACGVGTNAYAAHGQVEDLRLALAGTLYRGGIRRTAPRQDASLAHQAAGRRDGRARRRADARGTARGNDPLDRRPDGEGGGAQREFGSTHLARPWSATAPDAPVQAVQRSAFVDKLRDVVGLYVDPPAHAIVLSVDEKSQIQALDRTQPGLPLKKGRAGTMTHDYERHGTTTLFAAMNVLDGTVIGRNMQRHRHQEFIRFLNVIEKQVPVGKTIHAIVYNCAAHKHPNVRRWLERQPRWTFHFTPTSASWLNAVEGFFATLTKRRLKRGVFRSVADLQAAINRFLEEHNQKSQPFTWTADPDEIIAAVRRGHQEGINLARQEALSERAPGHKADTELFAGRQPFGFHVARPKRIFVLHSCDRLQGVRAANGCGHLRQSEMPDTPAVVEEQRRLNIVPTVRREARA